MITLFHPWDMGQWRVTLRQLRYYWLEGDTTEMVSGDFSPIPLQEVLA